MMLRVAGVDIDLCPLCHHGALRRIERLLPAPSPWDTS